MNTSRALDFLVSHSAGGPIDDPETWASIRISDLLTLYRQARGRVKRETPDSIERVAVTYHLRCMRLLLVGHVIETAGLFWYHGKQFLCARGVLLMYNDIAMRANGGENGEDAAGFTPP